MAFVTAALVAFFNEPSPRALLLADLLLAHLCRAVLLRASCTQNFYCPNFVQVGWRVESVLARACELHKKTWHGEPYCHHSRPVPSLPLLCTLLRQLSEPTGMSHIPLGGTAVLAAAEAVLKMFGNFKMSINLFQKCKSIYWLYVPSFRHFLFFAILITTLRRVSVLYGISKPSPLNSAV